MENKNNLDDFLSEMMSVHHSGIHKPSIDLVKNARLNVQRRKNELGEFGDFFALIAGFLNMKIKLYHAVIVSIIIGFSILYFHKETNPVKKEETQSAQYVSNIAAVRNTTVLSCINTFVTNK